MGLWHCFSSQSGESQPVSLWGKRVQVWSVSQGFQLEIKLDSTSDVSWQWQALRMWELLKGKVMEGTVWVASHFYALIFFFQHTLTKSDGDSPVFLFGCSPSRCSQTPVTCRGTFVLSTSGLGPMPVLTAARRLQRLQASSSISTFTAVSSPSCVSH